MSRKRIAISVVRRHRRVRGARRRRAGRGGHQRRVRAQSAVSGSVSFDGVWTGAGAEAVRRRDQGVQQEVSRTSRSTTSRSATTCRPCSRPRSPAAIRRTWRTSPSRASSSSSRSRASSSRSPTRSRVLATNFAPAGLSSARSTGKLYGLVFKAANKSTVWYNVPAFKNGGRERRRRRGRSSSRPRRRCRPRACPPTRSAAPTAGRSPTCSRTSTCARPGRRSTTLLTPHKIKWTDPSVIDGAEDDGAGPRRHVEHRRRHVGRAADRLPDSVNNVFPTPPKAAMVIEGDFVGGVITTSTKAKAAVRLQRVRRSRRSTAAPARRGRDRRRHDRHLPRHPGDRGVREVPRHAGGRGGLGEVGRLRDRQQERGRRASTRTRSRARPAAPIGRRSRRVRHVRPAAGLVRRHGRPGRVGDLPGLPAEPEGRRRASQQKLEAAAATAYKKGK